MLSLFSILAPPPREEAKRRQSNPGFVSPLRPGIRSGYTRISRRQPERGGCAPRANVATELSSQSEVAVVRSYCFSPFFTRRVNLGMRPFA